jgi:hypothetical protein
MNTEMHLKMNIMDELASNQIQINNKLFELLERTNQFQQNFSKLTNDKIDKIIELNVFQLNNSKILSQLEIQFKNEIIELKNKLEGMSLIYTFINKTE